MSQDQIQTTETQAIARSCYAGLFEHGPEVETQYPYLDDTRSISWNGDFIEQLSQTTGNIEGNIVTVTYKPEQPRDVYETSWMCINMPDLELRPEYKKDYRFRLLPFFGYLISTCELSAGPEFKLSLSPFSQLCLFTTKVGSRRAKKEKRRMGLYSACDEWVTCLPANKYYYLQMWGYSLFKEKSIMKWMMSDITHKYTYDLNVERYIEVQRFDPHAEDYVDVKTDISFFKGAPTIASPSLCVKFGIMTPEEKAKWKAEQLDTFYIYDMIPIESKDGSVLNYSKSVGLAQEIFFALEVKNNTGPEYVFNYTTDQIPTKKSRSAISSVLFPKMSPNTRSNPVDLYTPDSNTYIPGIFVKSLVDKVSHGNNGGSMIQDTGAATECKIDPRQVANNYMLRVEVLTLRKYTVSPSGAVSFVPDYA